MSRDHSCRRNSCFNVSLSRNFKAFAELFISRSIVRNAEGYGDRQEVTRESKFSFGSDEPARACKEILNLSQSTGVTVSIHISVSFCIVRVIYI